MDSEGRCIYKTECIYKVEHFMPRASRPQQYFSSGDVAE
jgi:hypothetical protein